MSRLSSAFRPKLAVPIGVLAAGGLGFAILVGTAPDVPVSAPLKKAPLVRVVEAHPQNVRLRVTTHGTVAPRTESSLVPEVSGPVVEKSPTFVSGGFFEKDEVLLRIDARDYHVARERAEANLARRESEWDRDRREFARREKLAAQNVASSAQLDAARTQARVSEAALREARANLDQARRDLARTDIRAPYRGRVRDSNVDVGQFVNRGTPVGTLYAIDYAEVRLPVSDEALAFLDLPLFYRDEASPEGAPEVALRARFAGAEHTWRGRIVRTEGEIDAQSRMVHAIARIDDPYGRGDGERPPLAVGLFVEAEILGREVEGAFLLPRAALRHDDRLYVVDAEGRLRIRDAEVLQARGDEVVLRSTLETSERVVVSTLDAAVEGMTVRATETGP